MLIFLMLIITVVRTLIQCDHDDKIHLDLNIVVVQFQYFQETFFPSMV